MSKLLRRALPLVGLAIVTGGGSLVVFGTNPVRVSGASPAASSPNLTALPLGDNHTTTSGPRAGYLYSCQGSFTGGGAQVNGPWIHGTTYDLTAKYVVDGNVKWPNATFKKRVANKVLKLIGNDLPRHPTGTFPIQPSDDAYQIDRNPNRISAHSYVQKLTAKPRQRKVSGCVGGQIGFARNGVAIFSAVDAGGRDAVAHEVQDKCGGHPQESGVYHYHGLPSCLKIGTAGQASGLVGWALDGFPIFGPRAADGSYLGNDKLDACHGTTSKVNYLGKTVRMYHYVANYEFPYTVGCYRGKDATPARLGSSGGGPPPGGP